MNPRLTIIAGLHKGAVFEVSGPQFSIGRDSSNHLCIGDASLSRRHCMIQKEEEGFVISDLQSLNGTFVNDVPTGMRTLRHGDRIRIGDSALLFLLGEDEQAPAASPVQFDERRVSVENTLEIKVSDAVYLMARDLSALMKISTTINSIRDLDKIQQQLLELIFEVVPAERGAILLAEEGAETSAGAGDEEFVSVYGYDRRPVAGPAVSVSRTVASKVLREGVAVLSNDVQEDVAFGAVESVITSRIHSLLCVPLMLFEKALGIIYLYTSDRQARFDKGHLQLVTAVAGIAAVALENARHIGRLEDENRRLRADINIEHNMVGESARMRDVYQFIAKVAPSDSTVMIRGESGTGKELAARAIHLNSPRARGPFIAVNCAALTETLLESELFGHEKGAFTGAVAQKKGKLEAAEGGTIFLDEVGEMDPGLQAKLLRVLQEREFERVGGTRTIKVDLRVIAATNKELEAAIKQGDFRQDLYYRLNVVSLTMPSLKDRRDDIPLLANYFVAKYGAKCNRRVLGISAKARAYLMKYDWPGNVRELENATERAVVLGATEHILPEDLPEALLETEPPEGDDSAAKYHEAVQEAKKQIILKAMGQAQGSYTEAAKLLGVHPNYLHRLIRNMDLKETFKKGMP